MQATEPTSADRVLQDSAVRHLAWDPEICSSDISVAVADGVVTLTGYVRSCHEKLAAEALLRILPGVRAIANDIHVAEPVSKTDPEIARAAVAALSDHAGVPKEGITVTVREGDVLLDGTVEWQFQRESAETSIAGLDGVKSVSNRIELRPCVSLAEVRASVELAGADQVVVETDGRTVRLSGYARSWEQRSAAERAVWSSPGVSRVENHIVVAP
jgi:osmotically-inducible protein OsmY